MSPERLAKLVREFLVRAEKKSALLLIDEFEAMREDLESFLLENRISLDNLDEFVNEVERQISERTVRFATIVTDAQRHVVRETARALNLQLNTSIFKPDGPAIRKLIGRTSDGGSLSKIFDGMKDATLESARSTLLESFAAGDGARQTASKLNQVTDLGYSRSLTISRTETVQAYRSASRDYFADADIKKYVWMSVLDHRVCPICWSLHGTLWESQVKVYGHPCCRCVLVPVTKGMKLPETGVDRFARLAPGFQKQILGPTRFELFKQGKAGLSDLIGSAETKEYGVKHFIRPLDDLRS